MKSVQECNSDLSDESRRRNVSRSGNTLFNISHTDNIFRRPHFTLKKIGIASVHRDDINLFETGRLISLFKYCNLLDAGTIMFNL